MTVDKSVFKSKTFWFGVLTMVIQPIFPQIQALVVANPQTAGLLWGLGATILRMITKGGVKLF